MTSPQKSTVSYWNQFNLYSHSPKFQEWAPLTPAQTSSRVLTLWCSHARQRSRLRWKSLLLLLSSVRCRHHKTKVITSLIIQLELFSPGFRPSSEASRLISTHNREWTILSLLLTLGVANALALLTKGLLTAVQHALVKHPCWKWLLK